MPVQRCPCRDCRRARDRNLMVRIVGAYEANPLTPEASRAFTDAMNRISQQQVRAQQAPFKDEEDQ